jgi:eukaryotic-like serine/threonine-protein kinase
MTQPSGASIAPGTRIGLYEIVGAIGSGGMGQVYRARDTRLDRDVALKILPEGFTSDADRVMRFTREAKTLASLNHPHIAHVYDAGREGARAFIAMELVEGEDLSTRIRRGAVPVGEALQLARQIADALAAAHDAGIVHRDLKPANIKVTDDGDVKVLDFGLAKGAAPEVSSAGDSGATMTSPAKTAIGQILGTASYMAPEQAKGKPVDRRADVWAFGVVLYEMLTGTFLFGRDDVTDTLAAVLTYDPDLSKLPAATPAAVRRLIEHCLVKDKKQRLDSMAAARIEIDDVISGRTTPAAVQPPPAPRGLTPGVATGLAIVAAIAGVAVTSFYYSRAAAPAPGPSRLVAQIAAPPEVISAFHDGFALSPDGSTLAFAARNVAGLRQLWIRRLDAAAARPIPGTEGGRYPFWAPDSRSFAFHADGKLKRVDVDGGRLQTICEAPGGLVGGSWNASAEILFGTSEGDSYRIRKVSADGGATTTLAGLRSAAGPVWLTSGQRFLFVEFTKELTAELRMASGNGERSDLIEVIPRGTPAFAYSGGVLFLNKNDALVAQRFDEPSAKLVGSAAPITPVAGNPKDWFAVSSDGDRVVAFVRQAPGESGEAGDPVARLVWVDRQGNTLGTLGDPGRYWIMRVSPDGTSAVVNPSWDLWWLRPDGRHTRLTTGAPALQSANAVWKSDGSELVFVQGGELVRRRIDPQSAVAKLGQRGSPQDWSSDGRWLLFGGRATTPDIMVYDFANKTARPWLATEFSEGGARFSPDGKWVAYASNVSGRQEVYLRLFEGESQPIAVSTNGGAYPFWRRDGNELFFLDPGDDVMAVSLTRSGAMIAPAKPQRLFRIPLNDITRNSYPPFGISPDGQRFLLNVPDRPTPLFYLQGLRGLIK